MRTDFCIFLRFVLEKSYHESGHSLVPTELRKRIWKQLCAWCGHGKEGQRKRQTEDLQLKELLDQNAKDPQKRLVNERRYQQYQNGVAREARVTMCYVYWGTVFDTNDRQCQIFRWTEHVFAEDDERLFQHLHEAIEINLLCNPDQAPAYVDFCYTAPAPAVTVAYMQAIVKFLSIRAVEDISKEPIEFWLLSI
eukprot:SAG31_NODE_6820_length_1878_cov_1.353569_3_plen_193_part_01